MTRWPDCSSIFGQIQQWKFAQGNKKSAKANSKLCHMLNKSSKKLPHNFKNLPKQQKFARFGRTDWNGLLGGRNLIISKVSQTTKLIESDIHLCYWVVCFSNCGQSYKASTIVNYDSRVVPDLKLPHITTLDS